MRIHATAVLSLPTYNTFLVKSCLLAYARVPVLLHEPRKHLRQCGAVRTRIEHCRVIELGVIRHLEPAEPEPTPLLFLFAASEVSPHSVRVDDLIAAGEANRDMRLLLPGGRPYAYDVLAKEDVLELEKVPYKRERDFRFAARKVPQANVASLRCVCLGIASGKSQFLNKRTEGMPRGV
jgi:hypothetical protein